MFVLLDCEVLHLNRAYAGCVTCRRYYIVVGCVFSQGGSGSGCLSSVLLLLCSIYLKVNRRVCASLSLVLKRVAGGLVTDGFLSSASCLRSGSLKDFLASMWEGALWASWT